MPSFSSKTCSHGSAGSHGRGSQSQTALERRSGRAITKRTWKCDRRTETGPRRRGFRGSNRHQGVRHGFPERCTFIGPSGQKAKCDFAIPSKSAARNLIEAKGYGATGSKMTDILGDIRTIVAAKRPDTAFLFFTDGLTWKNARASYARS